MKNNEYRIETLVLETPAGINIEHMKRLACVACLENRCTVTFVHNDRPYRVNFPDLLNCAFEQEKATH